MTSEKQTAFAVKSWPITKVIPYPQNAWKATDAAVEKVAASIKRFGFRQPIVVDTDGVIVAGHKRRLAAMKLGLPSVPVHVATDLSAEEIRAYRLMDNRSHEGSGWDFEALGSELFDLDAAGFDLAFAGFEKADIDRYLMGAGAAPPEEFAEYGENLETEHRCPKCGYRWSGKSGDEAQQAADICA